MACLLFACCEFMKGVVISGLRHIHAGLNIIDEWVKSSQTTHLQLSPAAKMIIQSIGPIFLEYTDKAPTYGMGDVPVNECACTTIITGKAELPCTETFSEIHRAHHALDGVGHHVARLTDYRRPAWIPSPPQEVQMLLESWRMHFETFEASLMKTRKQRFALPLQLLRVHYTMLSMMLRASASKHEKVYEQFGEEFRWIADKYDDFAEAWAKDGDSKYFTSQGNLEYHMGYIPPLFLTATKCRDPATRLAALKHLGSLRVAENNWTSCTAYLIARKIIKIEHSRSFNNKRTGLMEERDLIRPVQVFVSDKHLTQAGLEYVVYPYDSSPIMQDPLDLQVCPMSASAQWVSPLEVCVRNSGADLEQPLNRIIRIGGYQEGAVKPIPTGCFCGFPLLEGSITPAAEGESWRVNIRPFTMSCKHILAAMHSNINPAPRQNTAPYTDCPVTEFARVVSKHIRSVPRLMFKLTLGVQATTSHQASRCGKRLHPPWDNGCKPEVPTVGMFQP